MDENLVLLRHGLTAVNDWIGEERAVFIKGLDNLRKPIILKLDATQVKKLQFLIELTEDDEA